MTTALPTSDSRLRSLPILFLLTAVLSLAAPSLATATEVPLPEEGFAASLTTDHLGLLYARPLTSFQRWVGLRYHPASAGASLPLGLSQEWLTAREGRYQLISRAEIAPLLLTRDQFDLALDATLSVDNRFYGEYLGALVGLEMDAAIALTTLSDRRHRYFLVAGFGLHFSRVDAWLTGRLGYTAGGFGGGAFTPQVGLTLTFPR